MNLADAIRQASQIQGPFAPEAPFPVLANEPAIPLQAPFATELPSNAPIPTEDAMNEQTIEQPEPGSPSTIVRLELMLTPDQLASLFRAVAAGQHTMLTAREAAGYLRVPVHTLEEMAARAEVPGFQIDGRWRFAKQAIDEWLVARQRGQKEAA